MCQRNHRTHFYFGQWHNQCMIHRIFKTIGKFVIITIDKKYYKITFTYGTPYLPYMSLSICICFSIYAHMFFSACTQVFLYMHISVYICTYFFYICTCFVCRYLFLFMHTHFLYMYMQMVLPQVLFLYMFTGNMNLFKKRTVNFYFWVDFKNLIFSNGK